MRVLVKLSLQRKLRKPPRKQNLEMHRTHARVLMKLSLKSKLRKPPRKLNNQNCRMRIRIFMQLSSKSEQRKPPRKQNRKILKISNGSSSSVPFIYKMFSSNFEAA